MRRLALLVVLVIAAVGVTLQYFSDDLQGLLDVGEPSDKGGRELQPPELRESQDDGAAEGEDAAAAAAAMPTEVAIEPDVPVEEKDRATVQAIVEQRYPMPELPPFADLVGDWSRLPSAMLPARVQISEPLELLEKTPAGVVARALVAAGGSVRPASTDGTALEVESLARGELVASIPVAQTNLREVIEQRYHRAIAGARKRVEAQREEDFEWLMKRRHVVERLVREDRLWDDATEKRFLAVVGSVEGGRAGPVRPQDVGDVFYRGPIRVNRDGFTGQFTVVLVRFDFDDAGFGPLPYFSKCLITGSYVVGWLDPVPPWD